MSIQSVKIKKFILSLKINARITRVITIKYKYTVGRCTMIIKHHVPKEKEGTYYSIEFDVPENVETVSVEYSYDAIHTGFMADLLPSNTIDLGLADESGRFLGWSGSAKRKVHVGEYDSTSGYLTQKINPGKWQILIGAYRLADDGVDVEYNIEFTKKAPRWLYGDLHVHSTASDGKWDASEIGRNARALGLDFVALANHNNYAENLSLPHVDGLTFLPAVEWTHYKGHINLFGVSNPFGDRFIANSKEEMLALLDNARSRGALVSVNHPDCPLCPYLWDDDEAYDAIEIWNGPMTKRNVKAIERWTSLLKQGRRLPAFGGSDFHKPHWIAKLGNPVTCVYSESPSPADILKAMRLGHCFITDHVGSAEIRIEYGDKIMGDVATYSETTPLIVRSDAKRVILVTDSEERTLEIINGKAEADVRGAKFVYAKIISGANKKIVAVTNPIYFKQEV